VENRKVSAPEGAVVAQKRPHVVFFENKTRGFSLRYDKIAAPGGQGSPRQKTIEAAVEGRQEQKFHKDFRFSDLIGNWIPASFDKLPGLQLAPG
jgi:hypothetical protein